MQRKLVARVACALVLLSAVFLVSCDGGPSAPSPVASSSPGPAAPSPGPSSSPLVGTWNVAVRLTGITGSTCVAETMRSQIGVPNSYLLVIVDGSSGLAATLKSASGDRACTFSPRADSGGFTTYGQGGYYTCEKWFLEFSCSDGTRHQIFSIGEDISGLVSGNEISGAWDAVWFEGDDSVGVHMKAQFTGTRQ